MGDITINHVILIIFNYILQMFSFLFLLVHASLRLPMMEMTKEQLYVFNFKNIIPIV